jgi:hypothetical protein
LVVTDAALISHPRSRWQSRIDVLWLQRRRPIFALPAQHFGFFARRVGVENAAE